MSAVDAYIKKITELLDLADLELLDFIHQLLKKSVDTTKNVSSSKEDLPFV